ncbi:MAG: type VI secretion system protein TssA [Paracoccaceae bacterium]
MDAEALLQPRSDDSPSGENLEYDPVFTDMELAAQPGEEQVMGDEVKAGSDPDFREVRTKALEVMEQSHDLRAAVYLAEAILVLEGFEGFAQVTKYIRGCLEDNWATCHPELDEDDDDDPTMRVNAVQGLCGAPGEISGPSRVYSALRRTPLTDSRGFGRFSLRDMEIADGQIPAPDGMDNIPDTASVAAAIQDTDAEARAAMHAAAVQATDDVRAISKIFDENTPGMGPQLDPLIKLLMQISKRLDDGTAETAEGGEEGEAEEGAVAAGGGGGAPVVQAVPGAINSPADVSAALERIIAYYARSEPSSPLPLLLERAKRLVGADFMTIVKDMAPDGLTNVETVGGIEREY